MNTPNHYSETLPQLLNSVSQAESDGYQPLYFSYIFHQFKSGPKSNLNGYEPLGVHELVKELESFYFTAQREFTQLRFRNKTDAELPRNFALINFPLPDDPKHDDARLEIDDRISRIHSFVLMPKNNADQNIQALSNVLNEIEKRFPNIEDFASIGRADPTLIKEIGKMGKHAMPYDFDGSGTDLFLMVPDGWWGD